MALEYHDRVIEGARYHCPFLICEVCGEKLTDLKDGLVFWTPFARSQVAYCHKDCKEAFGRELHHEELEVFFAQLLKTLGAA